MAGTGERSFVAGLILALLAAFVAIPVPPAAAAPTPPVPVHGSTPDRVGFPLGTDPESYQDWQFSYYYWSLGYLRDAIPDDDPRIMSEAYADELGSHDKWQVGQIEHLLTAWYKSTAKAALGKELAKLEQEYEDRVEKQIAEEGVVEEAEQEEIRAEARREFVKGRAEAVAEAWSDYVGRYIRINDNRLRGKAFELLVVRTREQACQSPRTPPRSTRWPEPFEREIALARLHHVRVSAMVTRYRWSA